MNNSIIIQQAYEPDLNHIFTDMLRLTMNRHSAYALSHKIDYLPFFGDYTDRDVRTGGWSKIKMMIDCIEKGYEYVFWIDTDAAIMDFTKDLRDAFTDKNIGCCEHNAKNFPKDWQVPTHLNVGVTFVKNGEGVLSFLQKWWDAFPGEQRWVEQGSFNKLAKESDLVFKMDDKYNATVNVNMCENPVIVGWHGVSPISKRFAMMKQALYNDHIKYRV